MRYAVPKAAVWTLVLVVLLASLVPLASASSSTYTLYGYAYQPGIGTPVPAGVTVQLTNAATGQTYTTATVAGGQFVFGSGSNAPGLAPGSWGVSIPVQTNVTLAGCGPYNCAILPATTAPQFLYQTSGNLTSNGASGFVTVRNVEVLQYNATLSGSVTYQGAPAIGATVQLLDPVRNSVVLASNVTRASGSYSLPVPAGTWTLKTTLPGPTVRYNTTRVTIAPFASVVHNVVVQNLLLQGSLSVGTAGTAPNAPGNVTIYDPANGYIYTGSLTPSGYYTFGTYKNFTNFGTQPLDVFLSTSGTTTAYFGVNITNGNPITRNVLTTALSTAQKAVYSTVLNFSGFNVASGTGSLQVYTNATLGNNTVLSYLPNATVGQLWSQLGLDFAHGVSLPSAAFASAVSWLNSTGAFFPAAQAGTAINGTAFTPSSFVAGSSQPLYRFAASSACATRSCGPTSSASLNLSYAQSFSLSGSVVAKSPTYTISFNVLHPNSHGLYTYQVVLPSGYVLQAGTTAPAGTSLAATGPGGTWTSFLLTSYPSLTTYSAVSLPILRAGTVTPIVNITGSNFGFAQSANVLNGSRAGYAVVVGVGTSVTFSAQNSIFPAGTNATTFRWNFGNGNSSGAITSTVTSYTYQSATPTTPDHGSLTVQSSGGTSATTNFTVWVAPSGHTQANLSYNVTGSKVRSADGVPYLFLNWSEGVTFNATASSGNVSEPAFPGVLTVALFSVQSNGYSRTQNNSVSQGTSFDAPFTTSFLGNGVYHNGTIINGVAIPNFLGWRYFVNLSVWSGAGGYGHVSLVVLVNDTQKPVSAFNLLNAQGRYISGRSIIEGANQTAQVQLNGANSTDPNNGSVVRYAWNITNPSNTSFHLPVLTQIAAPPSYRFPGRVSVWLAPQTGPYTVNLTVWDRAGNSAYSTQQLTVAINTTTRPIMAASNLTGPGSVTQGSTYTYWVNVTTSGGSLAVATNITVSFYLLPPSGIGSRTIVVPTSSVVFYNYTNGAVNPTPYATGVYPALAHGKTVRAQISWSVPSGSLLAAGLTGGYNLYANISAQNEFAGSYVSGPQTAVIGISIAQNPINQYIVYGIVAAVVVVLGLLVFFWYRRRSRRMTRPGSGKPGLERGSRRDKPKSESAKGDSD